MPDVVIQAPESFEHSAQIPAGAIRDDPRSVKPWAPVVLDLRYCRFVRPPAALWCLVFGLLNAKWGQKCELLVPEDVGVARYLKTIGLFDLLKQNGVLVDDRDITPTLADQVAVQLQRFQSETDVDRMADEALERLRNAGLGAANMRPVVVETFAELANNAVQHSNSSIGSFGMVQYYEWQAGPRFVCAVADGGIGIRRSLERNPALRSRLYYDWTAVELALQERISGTGDPTRGIGLYGIAQDMRQPGRHLLVHSGFGIVSQNEELETDSRRGSLFPGTLAFASLAT